MSDKDDAGINAMRAHKKGTLPVVLTKDKVQRVIVATTGVYQLIAKLLYGSGLRLIEGLHLRVQDVDFSLHEVSVRDGKGEKDRITLFPAACAGTQIPQCQSGIFGRYGSGCYVQCEGAGIIAGHYPWSSGENSMHHVDVNTLEAKMSLAEPAPCRLPNEHNHRILSQDTITARPTTALPTSDRFTYSGRA